MHTKESGAKMGQGGGSDHPILMKHKHINFREVFFVSKFASHAFLPVSESLDIFHVFVL